MTLKLSVKPRVGKTSWNLYVGILNKEIKLDITRGRLISKTLALKKAKKKIYEMEKTKLGELEKEHKNPINPYLLQEMKEARGKIDKFLNLEIEEKFKFLTQSYYKVGPRSTRLLDGRLKKQSERSVYKLKDKTYEFTYEPEEIQKLFKNPYEQLYSQTTSGDEQQILIYFADSALSLNWKETK